MFNSYICLSNDQRNYINKIFSLIILYIVQEKDNYVVELTTKLHKKDATITVLQRQLEQSKQKGK